jgi:ketosteroid isomerase-like protein
MSRLNVEAVHQAFDAFTRRDKAAWFEGCDPDLEVVPTGGWPEGEIRGREAGWDFLVTTDEPWEPGPYELREIVDGDDKVVARQQRRMRGKSSGVEVDYDYSVVFTFRDDKVIRVEWFEARSAALEAAGLSE